MLAIVFGTQKFDQHIYGRKTKVETDHKPLESILKKSILSAPKRLQRMMMRLQRYDLEVTYKKGSQMYMANTLSRAYLPTTPQEDVSDEDILKLDDRRSEVEVDIESVNALQFLSASDETIARIRKTTDEDHDMNSLKTVIRQGWPDNKAAVPYSLATYFSFRDELSIHDGLIFKGERLVIPSSARLFVKERLHAGHIGIQGSLRRAQELVYWPGMNQEITNFISRCEVCHNHPRDQPKEPLISHDVPELPWAKVGCDLFQTDQLSYLITVDDYSNFFEVDQTRLNKTAKEVILKLKQHFARHGLPTTLISDNGPPFNSTAFADFAKYYGFVHNTSSPSFAQSNGKVENAVKTAKSIMIKAIESHSDPYLALLD